MCVGGDTLTMRHTELVLLALRAFPARTYAANCTTTASTFHLSRCGSATGGKPLIAYDNANRHAEHAQGKDAQNKEEKVHAGKLRCP
jgi:hypothetical protein